MQMMLINFSSVVRDDQYCTEAVLDELHCQINADDANITVLADYSDFDVMVMLSKNNKNCIWLR